MRRDKIVRNIFRVNFALIICKIFGYIRDFVQASVLGTSFYSDIYTFIVRFPGFFRPFSETALGTTFSPFYINILRNKSAKQAQYFAQRVLSLCMVIVFFIVLLVFIFRVEVITILGKGFTHSPHFNLVIFCCTIVILYVPATAFRQFSFEILRSHGLFFACTITPVFYNICLIIAFLFFFDKSDPQQGMINISTALCFSGLVQVLYSLFLIWKSKINIFSSTGLCSQEDFCSFLRSIGVLFILAFITQIPTILQQRFLTYLPGKVSTVYYADRVFLIGHSLICFAVSCVVEPLLARNSHNKNIFSSIQNYGMVIILSFIIPCAFALFFLSEDIVRVLFERNAFTSRDTYVVSETLSILSFGLPFYSLSFFLKYCYFSLRKTKVLFCIGIIHSFVSALSIFALLFYKMDYIFLPYTIVFTYFFNTFLLGLGLYCMGYMKSFRSVLVRFSLFFFWSLVVFYCAKRYIYSFFNFGLFSFSCFVICIFIIYVFPIIFLYFCNRKFVKKVFLFCE